MKRRVLVMKHGLFMKRPPIIVAGLLLGGGLGRMIDGTVFDVSTSWFALASARIMPESFMQFRMHILYSVIWVIAVIGLIILGRIGKGRAFPRVGFAFVGALLVGWGSFNVVQGVLYRELYGFQQWAAYLGDISLWDMAFMIKVATLLLAGWEYLRQGRQRHDDVKPS